MKANLQKIRKSRLYTLGFKKQLVKEFESGKFSVLELSRLHGIHFQSIYNWIYKYSNTNNQGYRIVEMKDSSKKKVKDLEQKVKDLEQIVGKKQIMIDYLEKMMEIAKDELDIDIKKNYNTSQSAGSGKTKKK
jgi:transposase-like protein